MSEEGPTNEQIATARQVAKRYGKNEEKVLSRVTEKVTETGVPFETSLQNVEKELESMMQDAAVVGDAWVKSKRESEAP